jgi:Rha family phage regulatory protein
MNAIPPIDFPSLCEEMHVTERDGVPVVNSRYVATTFERRHDHVLRDIAEIKTSPTLGECLGTSWFLEQVSPDAYGRHQPSFDLTRQGLTILCMGWAGERALGFKVRYIQAFDAMEKALAYARDNLAAGFNDPARLYSVLRQLAEHDEKAMALLHQLSADMGLCNNNLGNIARKMDHGFKQVLSSKRREITQKTRNEIQFVMHRLGGRCPCCGLNDVVDCLGDKVSGAEFDHFFTNQWANVDAVWLLCDECHAKVTSGVTTHDEMVEHFRSYQTRRRAIVKPARKMPRQPPEASLFGVA